MQRTWETSFGPPYLSLFFSQGIKKWLILNLKSLMLKVIVSRLWYPVYDDCWRLDNHWYCLQHTKLSLHLWYPYFSTVSFSNDAPDSKTGKSPWCWIFQMIVSSQTGNPLVNGRKPQIGDLSLDGRRPRYSNLHIWSFLSLVLHLQLGMTSSSFGTGKWSPDGDD